MVKLKKIREGRAQLYVPGGSFSDPFHLPVFYNPAMAFNRSISSLAMGCCMKMLEAEGSDGRKTGSGFMVLDGLCSLGARGIRYAKENKIKRVVFVDANPDAVKVLKKNIKLNKIKNAEIAEMDLNKFFLSNEGHYDFIEIDPFGSPVFFLQNAIRKLKKRGILSITATDLANLAGANSKPCIKHYGAKPLRCEYSHEVALRILVGRIAKDLMMQDFGCRPQLSFYRGHAIKTVVYAEKSAGKADEIIPNLGYIMHCHKCLMRESGKRVKEKCPNCGEGFDYAGELWIGKLQDEGFLKCVAAENLKMGFGETGEIKKMAELLIGENGFRPSFFDLHTLAKKQKVRVGKTADAVELLAKAGFAASLTHFSPTGIKTDAKVGELTKILK